MGRFFEIVTPDKSDTAAVRKQLDAWYRTPCHKVFTELPGTLLEVILFPKARVAGMVDSPNETPLGKLH